MHITDEDAEARRVNLWRIIGWGGAIATILTPLVAMQFTNEVNWDQSDFIIAAIIFGIVGSLIELAARLSSSWYFRLGALFAVLSGFILVWANLAVGMIGNEDNPVNGWFASVLLIAIAGSFTSRFWGSILPISMSAAGIAQASIGFIAGIQGTDQCGGVFAILLAIPWFVAGALFLKAITSAA